MILQCDQCQTKFRLDDSKLKPGGVKVRCSKCRHVFVAGAEPKQEESDFDAILSGLGAPAPEKAEQEPAPSGQAAGFDFEEEPQAPAAAAQAPAATAPAEQAPAPEGAAEPAVSADDFPDFSSFGFPAQGAAPEQKPAPEKDLFGDFDFSTGFEEPAAPPREEAKEERAAQPSGLDFGEFSFDEEPPAAKEQQEAGAPAAAAAAAEGGLDFGELNFDTAPAPKAEAEAPAAPGADLVFGEFEFNPEPVTKAQEKAPAPELEFGELSFNEEPLVEGEAAHAPKEFDFGDFSFEEEAPAAVPQPQQTVAPAADEEFLPAGFSFDEEAEPAAKPAVSAPAEELSFGDFSFEEEAPKREEAITPPRQDEDFVLGDFSFAEGAEAEPAPAKGAAAAPMWGAAAEEPAPEFTAAPKAEEWGDFAAETPAEESAVTEAAAGQAPAQHAEPVPPPIAPSAAPDEGTPKAPTFDFDFGPPAGEPGGFAEEEELPPLSISSRRKGRSIFGMSLLALVALLALAIGGGGYYLMKNGPEAAQTLDKVGLGFVGKWFGVESAEEGSITIKNPQASFYQNKEAGELFVVTGEALNSYKKPRASIHVKVSIFDKSGKVIMQKTAYCGNKLTKEQLETLPMAKIESIMNNPVGDSLSNIGVQPGQGVGFVVALANVPKEAADFGVEVIGSTVSTGK